jgi:hypothetical protein
LEHSKKEENEANGSGEHHGSIENIGVDAIDGDAEEGDDDGELCDDAGPDVEDLAEPPALDVM